MRVAPAVLLALSLTIAGGAGCRGREPGGGRAAAPPGDERTDAGSDAAPGPPLRLADYRPRSMLHLPAHQVPRARFPVVDFHQHVNDHLEKPTDSAGGRGDAGARPAGPGGAVLPYPAEALLRVMDAANVRTLVVLTGPSDPEALGALADRLVRPHPRRFVLFTQVDWSRADERGFGEWAARRLRAAHQRGARGLKVLKELGLYARDGRGKLLAVDDPRWDPIWRTCGELGWPVAIHTGDPEAFFHPSDAGNERLEELWMNPGWSFHGQDHPDLPTLLAARDRVIARHPRTTFVALHVGGWPENLDYVTRLLDRYPNVHVELGARQAELGRQPRRTRQLFLAHPDRILFGTDFGPAPGMYANHFRWLETADEYFPYHGHPEQGRWHIYGLELPDDLLEKIYHRNADRILGLARPGR